MSEDQGLKAADLRAAAASGTAVTGASAAQVDARGAPTLVDRIRQMDLLVVPVVAALLLGGWALGRRWEAASELYQQGATGASFSYPLGWICGEGAIADGVAAEVSCVDPYADAGGRARVGLKVLDVGPEVAAFGVEHFIRFNRPDDEALYAEVESKDAALAGLPGHRVEYAYAWREALANDIPTVMRAVDAYVVKGARLYWFTFATPEATFESHRRAIEYFLGSVVIP